MARLAGMLAIVVCGLAIAAWNVRGADVKGDESSQVTDADRDFWSFQPLAHPVPPEPADDDWSRTPVDRFILAKLREKGLTPNASADRRALIRRATFDLTGLPPTFEEVRAFVEDKSPDAYERIVDRLLSSPQHGERWARHWLDVARYGESMGFEHDFDYPYAYRYRDFVIAALNSDMSFDQFMSWQIAGDELAPDDPLALAATAFLTIGPLPTQVTEAEFEKARYDQLDDMASTTSVAFLGLTLGCARCHDHKYDPISSHDYYRFVATFGTTIRGQVDVPPRESNDLDSQYQGELDRCRDRVDFFEKERLPAMFQRHLEIAPDDDPIKQLAGEGKLDEAYKQLSATDGWWKKNVKERDDLIAAGPSEKLHIHVSSEGLPKLWHDSDERGYPHFYEDTYILENGDVHKKQEVATPGFLPVLIQEGASADDWRQQPPADWRTSYRRRSLANWLCDHENGEGQLVARVIINRVWQHHFGRGIVATPNDFGMQGERPTHPELLDWLAGELINGGWRLKPIHKLIMTSQVYMQSSASGEAKSEADSLNRYLSRQNIRRLEAEAIRDSMLATSGQLDTTMFGPGTLDESMRRRSIYFRIKRSRVIPMLQAFDLPEPLTSQAQRPTTTVSPQALLLLNHPVARGWAEVFAQRLRPAAGDSPTAAVTEAYRFGLQRDPTTEEQASSAQFLKMQTEAYRDKGQGDASRAALADLCQALFCLHEFIYVD